MKLEREIVKLCACWAASLVFACSAARPAETAASKPAEPLAVSEPPEPASTRRVDCTPLPAVEAEALLADANQQIDAAGEHPAPEAVAQILEKLRKAAYGGLPAAQVRYGWFVVSYYATDEMFWPSDRETAVGALGLLRFAVVRDPASAEDFPGLDQTPPDANSAFIQLLDPEWLSLALEEARVYEACVAKL